MDNMTDILRKFEDIRFCCVEIPRTGNAILNRCIPLVGSDCRRFEDSSDVPSDERCYLGQKYVWVKAPHSYDGFKSLELGWKGRILPSSETPPAPDWVYIDNVSLVSSALYQQGTKFQVSKVNFNPGLVAIIGSRGSGKSCLLNAIGALAELYPSYASESPSKKGFRDSIRTNPFSMEIKTSRESIVIQGKPEGEAISGLSDMVFVEQGEMDHCSTDSNQIKKMVLDLVGIQSPELDFDASKYKKMYEEVLKIPTIMERRSELETQIMQKNARIRVLQRNQHTFQKIHELHVESTRTNGDLSQINQIIIKFNTLIGDIMSLRSNLSFEIPPELGSIKSFLDGIKQQIIQQNETVQQELNSLELEIQRLELPDGSRDANLLFQLNKEIATLEDEYARCVVPQYTFTQAEEELEAALRKSQQSILDKWNHIKNGNDQSSENGRIVRKLLGKVTLEIIKPNFADWFYKAFAECLNKNKFKTIKTKSQQDRIREVVDPVTWASIIANELNFNYNEHTMGLVEFLQSDALYPDGPEKLLSLLFDDLSSKLGPFYELYDDGRPMSQLSAGQRGVLYLKVRLATASFSMPFVYDQPENELDNQFINDELVEMFKMVKKNRQVILVTHNANLVVGSEADQVIIASNVDNTLSYDAASLCDARIVKKICMILEGGEQAFRKRAKGYGIKWDAFPRHLLTNQERGPQSDASDSELIIEGDLD
jgi:ABC-type lipoprotein export system ATPase subunit